MLKKRAYFESEVRERLESVSEIWPTASQNNWQPLNADGNVNANAKCVTLSAANWQAYAIANKIKK